VNHARLPSGESLATTSIGQAGPNGILAAHDAGAGMQKSLAWGVPAKAMHLPLLAAH
jgi:hypothetical protein